MTAVTSRAERARQAELRELAALMRERGGMPAVPEPPALHQMAAKTSAGSPRQHHQPKE